MQVVGVGYTATIYDYGDGKVLKLFNEGFPKDSIELEFNNAMAVGSLTFNKPKAYGLIAYDNRIGILYDKIMGEPLLDWVLRTSDLEGCARYMANLHKAILRNSVTAVPHYKSFLAHFIKAAASLDPQSQQTALQLLDRLNDGNDLCHGDFHPGNILIYQNNASVIDFMNICRGPFLYDVARTVFLVEYTPVPPEAPNKEEILQLKRALASVYLEKMNVTREMIKDYLTVIAAARAGECPNEG